MIIWVAALTLLIGFPFIYSYWIFTVRQSKRTPSARNASNSVLRLSYLGLTTRIELLNVNLTQNVVNIFWDQSLLKSNKQFAQIQKTKQ